MDENKVIRPMDFVRLTNIDELNVIKDTKNHIGLMMKMRYVRSFIIISMKIDFIMRMGMCMLNH